MPDDRDRLERLMAAVAPLLDPDVLSPYWSAWEIENFTRRPDGTVPDGEKLWQDLKAAYDYAADMTKPAPPGVTG